MNKIILLIGLTLLLSGCTLEPIEYDKNLFKDYTAPWNVKDSNETKNETVVEEYNFTQPINDDDYLIGSFNIQIFGQKKANSNVMSTIEDIIDDYDILAIQEVRDLSGTVINKLNDIDGYSLKASPRLGRSSSKEQYIFFYSDRVVPGQVGTYPDIDDDFERPPYVMNFKLNGQTITFIQTHIKPDDAEQEIRKLHDVVDWAYDEFGGNNIYLMGDLNADTTYFDSFEVLERYQVLIDENNDTTTGRSNQAYDRILATEVDLKVLEVGVDNFEEEVNGNADLLKAVSDHYAVFLIYERVSIVN